MSLFSGHTVLGVPVDLAYHLVGWIAVILAPLTGGLATAAAIIAFTMLVRLLLLPLSYFAVRGSVRGEGARARLQPKLAELQRRHAGHPERLQAELGALYRDEGSGMFGGCLPLLIQLPFFSVMYRLFLDHSVGGAPNTLLTHSLLAAPLGSHWLAGAGPFSAQGAVFAGLFALLAAVAVLAVRAARRARPRAGRARGQHAELRRPVRVPGDRRDRAPGRRPLPAHHDGLGTGRADRAAPPPYFPQRTTARWHSAPVSLVSPTRPPAPLAAGPR